MCVYIYIYIYIFLILLYFRMLDDFFLRLTENLKLFNYMKLKSIA